MARISTPGGKADGTAQVQGFERSSSRPPHDRVRFQQLINYERARSDRSGQPVTLICFGAREAEQSPALFAAVLDTLSRRLRTIDEIGWLGEDRLAALLPYTSIEGAWKVADDVVASLPLEMTPPLCEVYAHTSKDDLPEGFDDEGEDEAKSRTYHPLATILAAPLPPWKRGLDILGAVGGLLVLSPLLAGAALAVKVTSPGPIFFRQWRTGLGGRKFQMLKFRSMVIDAEAKRDELLHLNEQDGPAFKIRRDPRVTAVGALLRKTSIDELPQLWNVLHGEMSLVGPRPLPCAEAEAVEPWQSRRHDVTPGLTCVWQVYGRSAVTFDEWVRMDLKYVRTRSIWQDLKLLFATIPAVILRRGAH